MSHYDTIQTALSFLSENQNDVGEECQAASDWLDHLVSLPGTDDIRLLIARAIQEIGEEFLDEFERKASKAESVGDAVRFERAQMFWRGQIDGLTKIGILLSGKLNENNIRD